MERTIVTAQIRRYEKQFVQDRWGQVCALIITLSAIVAGVYTASTGHEIAGSIIGVGGIGGIVTTFIAGRTRTVTPDPAANKTSDGGKLEPGQSDRRSKKSV